MRAMRAQSRQHMATQTSTASPGMEGSEHCQRLRGLTGQDLAAGAEIRFVSMTSRDRNALDLGEVSGFEESLLALQPRIGDANCFGSLITWFPEQMLGITTTYTCLCSFGLLVAASRVPADAKNADKARSPFKHLWAFVE